MHQALAALLLALTSLTSVPLAVAPAPADPANECDPATDANQCGVLSADDLQKIVDGVAQTVKDAGCALAQSIVLAVACSQFYDPGQKRQSARFIACRAVVRGHFNYLCSSEPNDITDSGDEEPSAP
jgi:hypothetical protein